MCLIIVLRGSDLAVQFGLTWDLLI